MGPESDNLIQRNWTRRRWRSTGKSDENDERCVVCDTAFNRPDTYYVRPAYTDGQSWICAACFDRMKKDAGEEIDHRYGRRTVSSKQ